MVSDKQYWRLMKLLNAGKTLERAAAASDMDEKTARKYRHLGKPPSQVRQSRGYRTRADVFADVWSEIVPFLESEPEVEATTLLEYLSEQYPNRFSDSQLRTLQRRVKMWRATCGAPKEVFFEQRHLPGFQAQSDFTSFNELNVTINRQPFPHLFYHFCLTYSNWETGGICFSESFEAFAEGLQNALWQLGKVPAEHRTDNLTAAVVKVGRRDEFTAGYSALLAHYSLRASHTNPASPNENGDVEQSHRRFKSAVRQSLILRGSRDFSSREEYAAYLSAVITKRNNRRTDKLIAEMAQMNDLPARRLTDATALKVRVSRNSTVWVKSKLYSVPSQLIGEWVNVELYAERLEVRYGDLLIEQIERVRGVGASAINYRHIIHSLVRKPGAFQRFRHRQQLFPQFIFRVAYDRLRETIPARADKEYLRILEMAALTGEEMVAAVLHELFENGRELSAEKVAARLPEHCSLLVEPVRLLMPVKVQLADYDRLLGSRFEEAGQ
jgi:transposase InsO family protein